MTVLDDIAIEDREDGKQKIGKDSSARTGNDSMLECKDSSDVPSNAHHPQGGSPSCKNRGNSEVDGSGESEGQTPKKKKKSPVAQKVEYRFYRHYKKEAEEHDKEFMKKYDDDLNTTLIFAGLFSAVASAFIILVHADFQPDLNEETTALLRVIIYTMDNTAFGGNVPTVPQWTGPPRTSVQVQAILFASLSASIFSAFLAMLGKQWLNRCVPANMEGTIVMRSQHRQQKLDGIINWYFDHVLESLPLMLQAALALLGCALSRYLWDINTIVASVIIGATSFGFLSYLFIVIVGATFVDCPYQTPGANILRHIFDMVRSAFSAATENSYCWYSLTSIGDNLKEAGHPLRNIDIAAKLSEILLMNILLLPIWLFVDAYNVTVWLSVGLARGVRQWLGPRQTVALNLRCISWTLRTSLGKRARLSALKYLGTLKLGHLNPTQTIAVWFDSLISCVRVVDGSAIIVQGTDQYAMDSSLYLLHTISCLVVIDPMPKILQDVLRRYTKTFPPETDFNGLQISHSLDAVRSMFRPKRAGGSRHPSLVDDSTPHSPRRSRRAQWNDYKPSDDTYITVARALTRITWFEYRRGGHGKVPRWLLRFALHSLSQDPPAPPSVIACSLAIIAIDLECDVTLETVLATPLDQSAQIERMLDKKLATLADRNWETLCRKHKAITALFPYAVTQEQNGRHGILDVFLRAAKTSKLNGFLWDRVRPYVETLFNDASHVALKRAAILASPYMPWSEWAGVDDVDDVDDMDDVDGVDNLVQAWVMTASKILHEKEVPPSVVDALFQITNLRLLRPHKHRVVWSWLKLRPSLPPFCEGRRVGSTKHVVQVIRNLNDIEILKSYLLLVWSEWDSLRAGFDVMRDSIHKDFEGVEMKFHRKDLVQQLDYVLRELGKGLEYLRGNRPELQENDLEERKGQYEELRTRLLAMENYSHFTPMRASSMPYT